MLLNRPIEQFSKTLLKLPTVLSYIKKFKVAYNEN